MDGSATFTMNRSRLTTAMPAVTTANTAPRSAPPGRRPGVQPVACGGAGTVDASTVIGLCRAVRPRISGALAAAVGGSAAPPATLSVTRSS